MKLSGIEIKNFRSIGENGVSINPFQKCNIFIGQNNVGKSNVIRAIKLISDHFKLGDKIKLTELDLHNRNKEKAFFFNIYFQLDKANANDAEFLQFIDGESLWFKFKWELNGSPQIIDHTFARVTDQRKSGLALNRFTGSNWARQVSQQEILRTFLQEDTKKRIWEVFKKNLPDVRIIPEFRQIKKGDKLSYDGESLVETLAHYQLPDIGKDEDQKKFNRIQKYLNIFLNLPDAKLEISRNDSTLIINNGIRLPLSSFGTSVHELLILLTSITSMDDSICCIEEPEIHFHPILQKEFLRFLITEPDNIFFISTHSPSFINAVRDNSDVQIIHLKKIEQTTEQYSVVKKEEFWDLLRDIGVNPSDILQSNCVIWVEGPSDIYYLNRWINLLEPNLIENKDYSFFCYRTHGKLLIDDDNLDHAQTNLLSVSRNSIVIMDSDRKNESEELKTNKKQLIASCEKNNIFYWLTKGREIENYLTNSTLKKSLEHLRKSKAEIEIGLFDKISEIIDKSLTKNGLSPLDYNNNKPALAKKISSFIEIDDVQSELKESLKSLIEKIKSFN